MKPYIPEQLPIKSLDWEMLVHHIGRARTPLSEFNGMVQWIPNPNVFLSPLMDIEAVKSSKVEDGQTTYEEVLEYRVSHREQKQGNQRLQEVENYREAMEFAINYVKEKPINTNLIKKLHEILMFDVRGHDKGRGRIRTIQNWIGNTGDTIEMAKFVPPSPDIVVDALSQWESYLHEEEKDSLVQLAILHAQFESIHPFLDGNGRIGRMLIPLFLYSKGLLTHPSFYISDFFEKNKAEYIQALRNVNHERKWNEWIIFFLNAIAVQAEVNRQKVNQIKELHEEAKEVVNSATNSQYSIQILDFLFTQPMFTSTEFGKITGIPKASVTRHLKALDERKLIVLTKEAAGRNPAEYSFSKLISIVD